MNRIAIVTGTSSGIGAVLAQVLLARGWFVAGVARRPAAIDHPHYSHLSLDLGKLSTVMATLDDQLAALISDPSVDRLALVNNAALIGLLGTVDQLDPSQLLEIYSVNVAAPVLLMGWLLRHGASNSAIRIVNVSSGAAVRGMPGFCAYGSSKAALRMAGMVLAAELDASTQRSGRDRDASILSIEPGIVDTAMQESARGSSRDRLPIIEFFKQAAAQGRLLPPDVPALAIADYIDADGHPRFAEHRVAPPSPQK